MHFVRNGSFFYPLPQQKIFAGNANYATFAVLKPASFEDFGSIAQLVQSICLTSRGSGVRIPLLPLIISHLQVC